MKDIFKGNCDIVHDLIPMYADGCTSEQATKALRTHILNCKSCRKYLTTVKNSKQNKTSTDIPDVSPDYSEILKKVKHRKNVKHSLVSALIAALIASNIAFAATNIVRHSKK